MPTRGIILGLALALWVSLFTFFNDTVIRQPLMTGNLMPTSVYGLLVVLTLCGGWWAASRLPGGGLSRADLAVMVVLATAACAWPGSNFFRPFVGSVGHPVNLAKSESAWQHNEVFSYVPGGSPRLAPGQVHNWRGLGEKLLQLERDSRVATRPRPGSRSDPAIDISPVLLERILVTPADRPVPPDVYRPLLNRLNLAITRETLVDTDLTDRAALDRLNRAVLVEAYPEHIDPIPPGNGVLLAGGQEVPDVTGRLVTGSDRREGYRPSNVPWSAWWPVLRLWGGVALCLAVAGLCLAVIVHPQWSRHEMLPYPLVRFVEELTRPARVDSDADSRVATQRGPGTRSVPASVTLASRVPRPSGGPHQPPLPPRPPHRPDPPSRQRAPRVVPRLPRHPPPLRLHRLRVRLPQRRGQVRLVRTLPPHRLLLRDRLRLLHPRRRIVLPGHLGHRLGRTPRRRGVARRLPGQQLPRTRGRLAPPRRGLPRLRPHHHLPRPTLLQPRRPRCYRPAKLQ